MKNLNYGVIGNCRSAALVSEDGSVDWLCLPEFDSPSLFAAILDSEKGGRLSIEGAEDSYSTSQEYIQNTNILRTVFASDGAEFEVLDFMPRYRSGNSEGHYMPPELYRKISVLRGSPKIRVAYRPAPDYARGKAVTERKSGFIESHSTSRPKDRTYLYSNLPLDKIGSGEEFEIPGESFILVTANEKLVNIDNARVNLEFERTKVYWLNWANRSKKYREYGGQITRSMLALKLLSFYSGAVLAAVTTSLPESVGEVRNWDYRFCWLRDASMSIETLLHGGHPGAAKAFMTFIQNALIQEQDDFQIMYGIRGERILTEHVLEHLAGYKDSRPVRIGNEAYVQRQNDSFGYLMDLIFQYYRYFPGTLDEIEDMWKIVKNIADTVRNTWQLPDKGIWEIRGDGSHFVFSKVMCWVALDRAEKISEMLQKGEYGKAWRRAADEIKKDVIANGWNEEIQSFTQAYDNLEMDSSLLLMETYGFISADSPLFQKTVKSVQKALFNNGLMYRYNAHDDFGKPSSAFTICTFWLVRALFAIGEKEEAKAILDELLSYSNHLGLFSEDLDFETKEQLGNFPQAYSHLALINTCKLFAEEEKRSNFIHA